MNLAGALRTSRLRGHLRCDQRAETNQERVRSITQSRVGPSLFYEAMRKIEEDITPDDYHQPCQKLKARQTISLVLGLEQQSANKRVTSLPLWHLVEPSEERIQNYNRN